MVKEYRDGTEGDRTDLIFRFPEETDELVIYSDGTEADTSTALAIFREQYPEVEVDFQIFGRTSTRPPFKPKSLRAAALICSF